MQGHHIDRRSGALALALERPASPWMLALIALGTVAYFIGGQLLNLPVLILALLPIGAGVLLFAQRSHTASMYTFMCTAFGLALRPFSSPGTDPIDILAGGILCMIVMATIIKLVYIERESVTYNTPQLLAALYLVWGLITGIGGILWWNNTWNDWLREFLLQSSLFLLPVLYVRALEANGDRELRFHKFLFGISIMLMFASVLKYAYTVSTSVYAYQIGRAGVDVSASLMVLLTCVAFAVHKVEWIRMRYAIIISVFCVGTIVLSGYRTLWVGAAVGLAALFLLSPPRQWTKGLKFLLVLGTLLLAIGTVLYLTVPIFKVFVMMTLGRLLSTTELGTDPSLVNRYIETDIVQNYIARSPITGYGYGARYQLYDWLLGYFYDVGFSHNGYYFVMFKTGVVGFLMIYTAYFWFWTKAIRLARDLSESPRVRALASVAVSYLSIIAISNITLNTFGDRNGMIWVGLCWGFILSREIAKMKRQSALTPALVNE